MSAKAQGFTLLELLVIISTVTLLAALLLISRGGDKSMAQVAKCMSNLRQWGVAGHMYAADNKDTMPTDGMGTSGDYNGTTPYGTCQDPSAWFNLLPQYMGTQPLSYYWNNGSPKNYTNGQPDNSAHREYSMPFPGRAGSPVWFCPAAEMTDSDANDLAAIALPASCGFFAYAMSLDLNKQVGTATPTTIGSQYPYPTMPKWGTIPKPAATVFLFDQLFNPISEPFAENAADSQYDSENPADRFNEVASRHNVGAVLSFIDGHAGYFKDYYITNDCNFTTHLECYGSGRPAVADIIWDPAFRAALGY